MALATANITIMITVKPIRQRFAKSKEMANIKAKMTNQRAQKY
jgi:hypothetical protein